MKQIMIIDDDPISIAIVKAWLTADYDVVTNASGLQAMGHLQKNPVPDLILLDIIMPGTDGMQVLKTLKENPKFAHIPVIFLTSVEDSEVQLEGYINGVDDFLQKPVAEKLLKLKIQRQLYIRDLEQENQHLKQAAQMVKMQIEQIFDQFM